MELTCQDCKKEIKPDNKFCPHCGVWIMSIRPQNEVKAELERLKKMMPNGIAESSIYMSVICTLLWVLGAPEPMSDVFHNSFEMKEKKEN